ncbi:pyridoxal-phosphate dependent enzyme [Afifella sp. JA880]|uniref:pyridoxal-phosphate dependent enzyme n=1 Tax=Afifella sp. JA880 TaxID=2975280 RepID=UPI0021BB1AB4|nr:pyridoxal-phosphate dependent enzyme [Afifella sp. JA880]MCT8265699.1 pyridoxal-phosphate dependent enzyme [Afifella sp. JA880]
MSRLRFLRLRFLRPVEKHLRGHPAELATTFGDEVRGAALSSDPKDVARGLVAASGGNHGLSVARTASLKSVPATIFLPEDVQAEKVDKMRRWGAETVIGGPNFDEADAGAHAYAEKTARFTSTPSLTP